ncbi:uncharacterized protein LOC124534951 [Vanessa cardui]|uniref:uncharacterized protein LOC124534951 n=1 Tax=Vanessa cardui TaxID=171605 RepID=UPI001F134F2D|nr:uncharacterized protein LOC124534951 [Vanessa cardui]
MDSEMETASEASVDTEAREEEEEREVAFERALRSRVFKKAPTEGKDAVVPSSSVTNNMADPATLGADELQAKAARNVAAILTVAKKLGRKPQRGPSTAMPSSVKIIDEQANVNPAAGAQDLMLQSMAEWQVDLAVACEPYFVPPLPHWLGDSDDTVTGHEKRNGAPPLTHREGLGLRTGGVGGMRRRWHVLLP